MKFADKGLKKKKWAKSADNFSFSNFSSLQTFGPPEDADWKDTWISLTKVETISFPRLSRRFRDKKVQSLTVRQPVGHLEARQSLFLAMLILKTFDWLRQIIHFLFQKAVLQKKRRWRNSGLAYVCFSSFHLSSSFLSFFHRSWRSIFFFCSSLDNGLHRNSFYHFFSAVQNPKRMWGVKAWKAGVASRGSVTLLRQLRLRCQRLDWKLAEKESKQIQFSKAPLGLNLRLKHRRCPGATQQGSQQSKTSASRQENKNTKKSVNSHQHTFIDGCSQSRNWGENNADDYPGVCEASSTMGFFSLKFSPNHCSSWRLRSDHCIVCDIWNRA